MKNTPFLSEQAFSNAPLSRILVLILFLLAMALHPGYSQTIQETGDHKLHLDDAYRIPYSGSYRDFTIPAGAAGKYLYLETRGGDGGTIDFEKDIHPGKGGQGATVFGYFKIGSNKSEIPVGATLRSIVGQAGGSHTNTGQVFNHSAGGGGDYVAPGGGGGYEGGAHGLFSTSDKKAGGGGSYVHADYVVPGTAAKIKNGTTRKSENGYVQYQFFNSTTVISLPKGQQFSNAESKSLLTVNDHILRWQNDGNLVLRNASGKAVWASNTNGKGTTLAFQNDGNLVIRDAQNKAIWASATANDQQAGKGGTKLILNPFGHLYIFNRDNKSIWSKH